MFSASFFTEIKIYSQRNTAKEMFSQRKLMGTDKENIVPGKLYII